MMRRDAGVEESRRSLPSCRDLRVKTFKMAFFAIVMMASIWGCSYRDINRISEIVDGALIVPRPSNADELKTPKGFYHSYDYAFFDGNLEKNVADRIAAYMSSN